MYFPCSSRCVKPQHQKSLTRFWLDVVPLLAVTLKKPQCVWISVFSSIKAKGEELPCYPKSGPQTSHIRVSWELVRNKQAQISPHTSWLGICSFTRSPGDLCAPGSLRSTKFWVFFSFNFAENKWNLILICESGKEKENCLAHGA